MWTGRTQRPAVPAIRAGTAWARTLSWPAGARMRGCRADLPPQLLAWAPAEAGDQGRAAAGAWRSPRPARRRVAWEAPAWPAAAPGPSGGPAAGPGGAGPGGGAGRPPA